MEKNFAFCATKKINILTLVLSEKKILNETKNHNPPFKLNGRSLTMFLFLIPMIILELGMFVDVESYFDPIKIHGGRIYIFSPCCTK